MNNKQVEKIRKLLVKEHGFAGDEIDLESEVDNTLTFEENWNSIVRKFITGKGVNYY